VHIVAAAVCVAALLSVISRVDAPMSAAQIVTFYGLPTCMVAFFSVAALSPSAVRLNLLILALSIVAAAFLGEVAARAFGPPAQFEDVAVALGNPDTRSKTDVIDELKATGTHAYPELSPWGLRSIPDRMGRGEIAPLAPAPSHSTIVSCLEGNDGRLVYESDDYGFRSLQGNPDSQATTIALLGDSFVFGQCVSEEQTLAGRLRHRWSKVRNLGVSGAGPLHQLAVLREYGPIFQPRMVVWVFFEGNDLIDLHDELASPNLSQYLDPKFRQGIPERQEEVDSAVSATLDSIFAAQTEDSGDTTPRGESLLARMISVFKFTRLRSLLGMGVHLPLKNPLGPLPDILRMGKDEVATWGGTTVLVYLPDYGRYRFLGGESYDGRREFLEAADSLNIPLIDLDRLFQSTVDDPRKLWIHPRGHLNPEGYAVVADAIADSIANLVSEPSNSTAQE
jgi:hypothetical protein